MGKRAFLILAAALTALAFAGTASAVTHWVNDNGTPNPPGTSCSNPGYNTIQAAVDAASPGDTVRVCSGTYNESVTVGKTLTIKGPKAGVDARTRGTTGEANVTGVDYAFQLNDDDIVLDGFRIRNTSNGPGVYLSHDHNGYQVLNNIIQNNVFGIYANSAPGTQSLIRRNLMKSNNMDGSAAGNGIYMDQGTQDMLIQSNKIQNQLNAGVLVTSTPGVTFNDHVRIESNKGVNNTTFVNVFGDNRNITIKSNTTNDTVRSDDGDQGCMVRIDGSGHDFSIDHNTFTHAPFAAICLRDDFTTAGDEVTHILVTYNTSKYAEFAGIDSTNSADGAATVDHNNIRDGEQNGIRFGSDTKGNHITNNTALGNQEDCVDQSTGTGTDGTANTWTNDIGRHDIPNGICRPPS